MLSACEMQLGLWSPKSRGLFVNLGSTWQVNAEKLA